MNLEHIYLAFRKRIRLLFFGRYFVICKNGVNYLIDIYSYIDRRIEAYGVYEYEQLTYFKNNVIRLKSSLVIDCGAHSGLYAVNLIHNIPGIKVIAFEPDDKNRAHLVANLYLNGMEELVQVEGVALSAQAGYAKFHRHDKENPGRSMLTENGEYSVVTKTLDEVVKITGERVAIKVDVEGHELPLLKGASRLLRENQCFLQIESFSPGGVFEFLDQLGYSLQKQYGNDYFFEPKNA